MDGNENELCEEEKEEKHIDLKFLISGPWGPEPGKKKPCSEEELNFEQEEEEGKKKKKKKEGGKKKKKDKKEEEQESIRAIEERAWAKFIKEFTEKLKTASFKIDDVAPRLSVGAYFKSITLSGNESYARGLDDSNKLLIGSMNRIERMGGRTDTFESKGILRKTSNAAERRMDAMEIEAGNLIMYEMIQKSKTRMETVADYAERWRDIEKVLETTAQFPLYWKIKEQKKDTVVVGPPVGCFKQHITEKSARYPDKRPRVVFELSLKGTGVLGKFVVMLYSDYVPKTTKNFLTYCDPKAKETYKGCKFYLIFPDYYCQTGDVVENRGFATTSIYGPHFPNEDDTLQHGERGLLTTYQALPNRNNSQFLITFKRLKSLNGKQVVFGKIIKGLGMVDAIESFGAKRTGRPKADVFISHCEEI